MSLLSCFLGAIFVVSGVAKGVDPVGLAYKLEEYLNAFGLSSLDVFSAPLAVGLCAVEIALGLLLLLGRWRRIVAVALVLFMVLFTVVTFEIYTNPYLGITECGCFGDAIELSNGATFWKNVVLLLLAIANLFGLFTRHRLQRGSSVGVAVMVLFISFSLPLYSYIFLPPIDFLEYNIGDSVLESGNITIYDSEFNDVTHREITEDGALYIVVTRGVLTPKNRDLLDRLADKALDEGRGVIAISSDMGLIDDIEGVEPYFVDDLVVKSMMRRDAGVVLVEKGQIMGKWSLDSYMTRFSEGFQLLRFWIWLVVYLALTVILFKINFRLWGRKN